MHFVQRIYINDKPLILTNSAEKYIVQNPLAKGYEVYVGAFHRNFRMAKKELDQAFGRGVIIEDIDVDVIKKEVASYFKPISAGGGIVSNENGDILMIFRRGKWDLPKGKLDEGESIEECAVREVQEETGLDAIELGEKIVDTYHIYSENKKEIIKTTVWFKMKVKGIPELIPQAEENIVAAKWIPVKDLGAYVKQSYQGIRDVLHQAALL
jgi:8-oxo-dGTP pyrophosphatase MutT (NUDIX family)